MEGHVPPKKDVLCGAEEGLSPGTFVADFQLYPWSHKLQSLLTQL